MQQRLLRSDPTGFALSNASLQLRGRARHLTVMISGWQAAASGIRHHSWRFNEGFDVLWD
jgi:hypothetical protein